MPAGRAWRMPPSGRRAPSGTPAGPRGAACRRRGSGRWLTISVVRRKRSTVVISRSAAVKRPSTRCLAIAEEGGEGCRAARPMRRRPRRAKPSRRPARRRAAGRYASHGRDRRLDGVSAPPASRCERVPAPARRAASAPPSAAPEVHDDRARLEQHQAVVVDRRHLAEGLHRSVGRPTAGRRDRSASPRRECLASSSAQRTRRSRTRPWANGGTQRNALRRITSALRRALRRRRRAPGPSPGRG